MIVIGLVENICKIYFLSCHSFCMCKAMLNGLAPKNVTCWMVGTINLSDLDVNLIHMYIFAYSVYTSFFTILHRNVLNNLECICNYKRIK